MLRKKFWKSMEEHKNTLTINAFETFLLLFILIRCSFGRKASCLPRFVLGKYSNFVLGILHCLYLLKLGTSLEFLQLLEPGRYMWLLKALYGLLMLLPQVCLVNFHCSFPFFSLLLLHYIYI